MFVAPPTSGHASKPRQLLNKLRGKKREILETEKHNPEQIREAFITALEEGKEDKAAQLLKKLSSFKNSSSLRRFFRIGQIKEDKVVLEKLTNIIQDSGANTELRSRAQNIFKQYIKEAQGKRLTQCIQKTEHASDAMLDSDMTKALDAMVDFISATEESEKTTHANRLLRALNIPLHEASSLRETLNSANAPFQLTALINTMKDSKTPALNILYNLVFTEGNVASYSDTTFGNLFTRRDKASDPYKQSRNGDAMIDQLTDSYFKKNGMIDIKGKEKEHTTLSINPLDRKVFAPVKVSTNEQAIADEIGLSTDFEFSFPKFLKEIAHGDIEPAYDNFMKAYIVLAQRRADARKGIDRTGTLGDLSTSKARDKAETKLAEQQAYMLEILQSQAILGDEAHDAIREHLRDPKIVSTIIANLYKHYEISLTEGQEVYALDTINDIEKNIAWIKDFPLEVEINGQKQACQSIEDLLQYASDRDKDTSEQALQLTSQILDTISGGEQIIESNDSTFGFGDSKAILEFAEDCDIELTKLRYQFEKECKTFDADLDRAQHYIVQLGDLSRFEPLIDSNIITFEHGEGRSISGLDIEGLENSQELIEQLQIIYSSNEAYDEVDQNCNLSAIQDLLGPEGQIKDQDQTLEAISQSLAILKKSRSTDPKIVELRAHLGSLMAELKEGTSLKGVNPSELQDPRDTLKDQMNQTIRSVLELTEHSSINDQAKLYFNNASAELPEDIATASGSTFEAYRHAFFNDVIVGAYDKSGGVLKQKLHQRSHITAVETLLARDPSDPSLNTGRKLIHRVLEAESIGHAKFRPNQEAGLLIQMLNAEKTVAEVSPLGDIQSVRVLDEATSFTALMELRNRALTLASNDQKAIKQINDFFYGEALDGVIPTEAGTNLDLSQSQAILGKSSIGSEVYDSKLAKLYHQIKTMPNQASSLLSGLTGYQRMAVLTDLRAELEEKVSGIIPKLEQQANKNFFGFLSDTYTPDELSGLAPVLETVAEEFEKTRSEIANLKGGYNSTKAAKIIEKNFGVKLNDHLPRLDSADLITDSMFYMMDTRKNSRNDIDSFVQLIIDFVKQIFDKTNLTTAGTNSSQNQ